VLYDLEPATHRAYDHIERVDDVEDERKRRDIVGSPKVNVPVRDEQPRDPEEKVESGLQPQRGVETCVFYKIFGLNSVV